MKKLFTFLAAAMSVLSTQAADYTGKLTVSLNGVEASSSTSTITINKGEDGTYDLHLKNFVLGAGDDSMPVGTINIAGVASTDLGTATLLQASQEIEIEAGDTEGVGNDDWLGPMLGEVPVEMVGKLEGDEFHTVINIEFMGMEIAVEFGDGYQLPNSGFENYHDISDYNTQEPNGWHMFYSGTGKYVSVSANMFSGNTNYSTEVRPGSTGEKCLKLVAGSNYFGIIPNGTITTGRLMVGAISATSNANYSFNDISLTETDGNGDRFYAAVSNQPDSLTVWVKFKQTTPQSTYKYASVSALLNNGSECRDPENDSYNSGIVAKAANTTIESLDGEWQRLSIPFDYVSYAANNAEAKALLVTFSTNATPGKGSANDELYVDDIALVYNGKLASLKYDGVDVENFAPDTEEYAVAVKTGEAFSLDKVEAVADGRGAYVVKTIEEFDEATGKGTASVRVVSADLKTISDYYINFTQTTGINAVETAATVGMTEVYNAAGQRIDAAGHGLSIIKQGNKVVKVMKK